MTVSIQSGFGAFGQTGTIPTVMSPSVASPDWIVQYIPAGVKPLRLRSLLLNGLRPLTGASQPIGSIGVPYFIAVGPMPQAASLQAGQTLIPAQLFANTTTPFVPSLQQFVGTQFICMEAGIACMNPWIPRTWTEREIVAVDGMMIVVAAATPVDFTVAGTPLLQNSVLFMTVLGQDDTVISSRQQLESSLARFATPLG